MQKYVSPEATLIHLSLIDVIMASAEESECPNESSYVPLALDDEGTINTKSLV